MNQTHSSAERNVGAAVLILLILGCLLVMRPFVSALLWALVLCCASWPLYMRLLRYVGQRRTLAAMLMCLAMVLLLLMPFFIVGMTLADNVKDVTAAVRGWIAQGPPQAPQWLEKIPVVGHRAVEQWNALAADTAKFWTGAQRFIEPVSSWLLRVGLALMSGVVELALSIFIAFFFFRDGVALAERLNNVVHRIAGDKGKHLLTVANKTVRGVVYGILGTALCQAVLAGIGFVIAGVPGPAFLALMTFFCSVIPVIGVGLVWIPAAIWLYQQGSSGWAIFITIWGLGVGNVDNVIKPWLISQGSDMPFILIFFGVIGGALTFGFIGVFLGPTLLAVGYRIIEEWASAKAAAAASSPTPPVKSSLISELHPS